MKPVKTFESFRNKDNEHLLFFLNSKFSEYFQLDFSINREIRELFNIDGYTEYVSYDDGAPGPDYDYDNEPELFRYYMIKKGDIDIFQAKMNYAQGTLELDKIIHRNHYRDLMKENWDIVNDFLWEKFKEDELNKQSKKFNL